jgi:hypothetical protein
MTRRLLLLAILLCACAESAPGGHAAHDAARVDASPPPPDVMQPPDAAPGKEFGDPCRENRECRSGYCIETPEAGRICTRACGECPDGYECKPIDNGGADRLFLCLPREPDLCKPCRDDRDCDGSRCLDFGPNRYCGADCADGGACPAGYECADVDGAKQCVPAGGRGCAGCVDHDGDGYGDGADCMGFDCDDGDPSTHVGAVEVCDDKDNDCNALVDDAPRGAPDVQCLSAGVCGGAHLACIGGGWRCNYPDTWEDGDETRCDGLDNDCDGQTDEHLLGTPDDCGFCGQRCAFPHAAGLCVEDGCERGDCERGWNDADGNDGNGCEYACNPTRDGEEVCDQIDNDCDGHTDEGFDTARDPSHCGACDHACAYPHGVPACADGACALEGCEAGWANANGRDDDGCELPCVPSGDEVCDGTDNDCDGHTDEGFDTQADAANCGECGHVCAFDNASAECHDGRCVAGACARGFHDVDGLPGCEYACNPTRGGVEACDEIDNDCDGHTDEDFDLTSDAAHCGACDHACGFPNGVAGCEGGRCVLSGCAAGFVDLDGPDNGCEYACTPTGDERCNGADDDCDGHADEGFDLLNDAANCGLCGRRCAPDNAVGLCMVGECGIGSCAPGFYDLDGRADDGCEYACVPQNGGIEACNGVDDDCDGRVDEDFDLHTDASNCGICGRVCDLLNAESACQDGECAQVRCLDGFVDVDGAPGCEYACIPQNGGAEVCNRADDDCDGQIDEGTLNRCGGCGPEPAEVCNGVDDDCDGQVDEGTLNRCGGCGPEPAEVCNGVDDDCDGVVDDHGVCGPYVQQQCRVFFGWGDNNQGPATPSDSWGNCPNVDRYTTDNVRCTGTRGDGNYAMMPFRGDVDDNDRFALMFRCDDGGNPGLAAYVQSHCALYLGHADNQAGPDNTPVWGPCPNGVVGDDGILRCTSTGYDGRFRAVTLVGDVDDNDDFAVAWICRDDADPGRAAALQRSVEVFLGWADLSSGLDGVASWAGCPPNESGVNGRLACVATRGDGLFHRLWIGAFDGNVDGNDQIAWALRALAAP